jgi:uncharacterized protein (TIGR03437 family)
VFNHKLLSFLLTTVAMCVAGGNSLHAQGPCTSNFFTIASSNGASFPASGGSTTISWLKQAGGSNDCPSFITTTASWLTLQNPASSSTTGTTTLTIAPNPTSATRSAFLTVQSSATDTTSFNITQIGSTLVADATSLTFSAPGGTVPLAQYINVTASGGAVQIAALPTSSGNWLSVAISSPSTPSQLTVSANPAGLAPGTYQGSIKIVGGGLEIPVSVSLNITSAAPALSFTPTSVSINGRAGSSDLPAAASVLRNTGSTGSTSLNILSDQPWLSANSSGVSTLAPGQTATITVSANAATLKPGTYTGHVTAQGTGTTATLTVTFTVAGANVSALVDPITLSISSGVKKSFPGVGQLTGDPATLAISVLPGANFLSADATATSPGKFGVNIDATGLAAGNYSGTLLVQCTANSSCLPFQITVVFTVNPGSGALNFQPSSATLTLTSGNATPQVASVSIQNDGSSGTSFTISSDAAWLTATPATGTIAAGQKAALSIAASTATLAPGTYTGHIYAQGTGTTGTYTVTLTVTGANVTASPNPLSLTVPAGTKQTFPAAVQLNGDSTGANITVTQGNAFLAADGLSQSPGSFSVTVDATKLNPGTYPGTLAVRCTIGCVPQNIAVSVVVTQGSATLSFASPGVTLSGNAGSLAPQSITTTLTNSGTGPTNYTLSSDQPWLTATPSSGTLASGQSANIVISASTQNLAPGSYTGRILAAGVVYTVNVNVSGVSLYVLPSPATYTLSTGTKQTFSNVQVLGGSAPVSIAVTSGSIWLSADAAVQAPGNVSITVDATYLKPGSYSGTLAFTCQTSCISFNLPVSLTVTSGSGLTLSPSNVTLSFYQTRSTGSPQTVSVKSSDNTPIGFTIANPLPWLTVSASSGITPATVTLTPKVAGLTGPVSGNLTFTTDNGQAPVLLPVALAVQPFSITATPSTVSILAVVGQKASGKTQIDPVDGAPASLQLSTSTPWLSAPANFTAPGPLILTVDATGLGAGQYSGTVTVACAAANPCTAVTVPVSLTVTATAILLSDTQAVTLPQTVNGATVLSQPVKLTSSDGNSPITFTVDTSTIPTWLSVAADRNTTPATLTFGVPAPPAQAVTANVRVTSPYGNVAIAVNYNPPAGPAINSTGVVSAAGLQAKLRSGSWGTLYGSNLATTSRDWNPDDFSGNAFPTSLDGVSVKIGGKAAFVRTVSTNQINFQVPDGIGTGSVPVTVTNSLGTSNVALATIDNYAPAFFIGTVAGGRNYVAATEAVANGVIYIGPASASGVRPAKPGEILTLWGTGFGPTTPLVPAGSIFNSASPLDDSIQILIDGTPAALRFAGISGAGLYQFNIVVPSLTPGDHKLTAIIGGAQTADGIWLATQ